MKLTSIALATFCLFTSPWVLAQSHGARGDRGERAVPVREARPEAAAPAERRERIEERRERMEERREHLSQEERRQLREDVGNAGREIYHRPRAR